MAGERRWIVLAEDGRHSTIGRHSDPTEAELAEITASLRQTGIGAWLAVTEGTYYNPRDRLSVMMVSELTPTAISWDDAVAAFLRKRTQALDIVGSTPPAP